MFIVLLVLKSTQQFVQFHSKVIKQLLTSFDFTFVYIYIWGIISSSLMKSFSCILNLEHCHIP